MYFLDEQTTWMLIKSISKILYQKLGYLIKIGYCIPQPLPDIEERFCFMNLDITNRTIFAGLQIPHNAHFADCDNKRRQINYLQATN